VENESAFLFTRPALILTGHTWNEEQNGQEQVDPKVLRYSPVERHGQRWDEEGENDFDNLFHRHFRAFLPWEERRILTFFDLSPNNNTFAPSNQQENCQEK
jgi:hypothetical protein